MGCRSATGVVDIEGHSILRKPARQYARTERFVEMLSGRLIFHYEGVHADDTATHIAQRSAAITGRYLCGVDDDLSGASALNRDDATWPFSHHRNAIALTAQHCLKISVGFKHDTRETSRYDRRQR